MEPPKACLVSRVVPPAEFESEESDNVRYAYEDLKVTYVAGSLVWHKDGKTGLVYENPLNPDDYDDMADGGWNGTTTAVAYGPLTSGKHRGCGVVVWREGWSHALLDESYYHVTLGADPDLVEPKAICWSIN